MGCTMSQQLFAKKNQRPPVVGDGSELNLTMEQKRLLKESWELFQPKKTAIGRKMFIKILIESGCFFVAISEWNKVKFIAGYNFLGGIVPWRTLQNFMLQRSEQTGRRDVISENLFKINPEMQNLFPEFRGAGSVEKLEDTKFLNGHSRRLMTAVENAVTSMNDTEACTNYLHELGRRHKLRKLKPHYLQRMGTAMMTAFKDLYPEIWTSELEEAWNIIYKYIAGMMISGLNTV